MKNLLKFSKGYLVSHLENKNLGKKMMNEVIELFEHKNSFQLAEYYRNYLEKKIINK